MEEKILSNQGIETRDSSSNISETVRNNIISPYPWGYLPRFPMDAGNYS